MERQNVSPPAVVESNYHSDIAVEQGFILSNLEDTVGRYAESTRLFGIFMKGRSSRHPLLSLRQAAFRFHTTIACRIGRLACVHAVAAQETIV